MQRTKSTDYQDISSKNYTGYISNPYKHSPQILYHGSSGDVVLFHIRNKPYIMKKFKHKNLYIRESLILKTLTHPNIIKCCEELSPIQHSILLPFCKGGDLFEWVGYKNIYLDQNHIRAIFIPIIQALLHAKNSIHTFHGDIKPDNICMNNGIPLLIDWGLARSPHYQYKSRAGTPSYYSPQKLWTRTYDYEKNDVWSLAITIWNLCFKNCPIDIESKIIDGQKKNLPNPYFTAILKNEWELWWRSHLKNYNQNKVAILESIFLQKKPSYTKEQFINLYKIGGINEYLFLQNYQFLENKDFKDLMQNMLNPDEKARFTLEQVLNHTWFLDNIASTSELQTLEDIIIKQKNRSPPQIIYQQVDNLDKISKHIIA
jgi:serine/threonine protein kinase